MKRFLFSIMMAGLMIGPIAVQAADGWSDNLQRTQAAAKKSGKVVVIDFTGSDW